MAPPAHPALATELPPPYAAASQPLPDRRELLRQGAFACLTRARHEYRRHDSQVVGKNRSEQAR